MKNLIHKLILSFLTVILFTSEAHFGSKGPYGGTVTCATVYDSIVYLGTKTGGVYQSANSKIANWTARPVGLKQGHITALAHTGKYLIAGTADSGVFIFNGYVGSDRYWRKINNGIDNLKITALLALDTATIMAGTNGSGVFITTNKGANWTAINNTDLHHLEIVGLVKTKTRIIVATTEGLWATENNGASWYDYNDENSYHIENTSFISYNSATEEIIILNDNGLLKSSVASTKPSFGFAETNLPDSVTIQSISNNGDVWYAATSSGVYASLATSFNWQYLGTGFPNSKVNVVVPFRTRIIAGTEGDGIYKINDVTTALTWSATNTGFNNLKTYSLTTSGALFVAAATEKGVFVSKDLAASYTKSNKGLSDSLNINDILLYNGKLFAASANEGVFVSADSGKNWSKSTKVNLNVKKLFGNGNIVYAVANNGSVLQYENSEWTEIFSTDGDITHLAFSEQNIYVSVLGSGVYKGTYNSNDFMPINFDLGNLQVSSLTFYKGILYAGTLGSGVWICDTSNYSWSKTTDTKISHTDLMQLDGSQIESLAAYNNYVFASYKGGLLASADSGKTWIAGGNQFNLPSFTHVYKISFVDTRVFVCTENNGLYSNALSELPTVVTGTNDFVLNTGNEVQVYPNPSTGQVQITTSLANEQITVYNHQGTEVFSTKISSNSNNLLDFAPGMYFVVAEKASKSIKLIIK